MDDCQNGNSGEGSPAQPLPTLELVLIQRILDANLNRASEGLRVAEEYARFALNDAFLSQRLKESRHILVKSTDLIGGERTRLTFRDVENDVGTQISVPSEAKRDGLKEVAHAALKRTQQALRSLEEYGKTVSVEFARECEKLRYESYSLEKATLGVRDVQSPLASARVYVLLDGRHDLANFERDAREIAAAADVIQLRDKSLLDGALLGRANLLRAITREFGCLFIVNDRPDIAVLAGADGVHVGQDEIGVHDARRILGEKSLIGVSTHSIEQLRKAILDGASYVGCGPVFSSSTKSFDQFAGVEFLQQAARETSLPSFAIGGINLNNLDQVIAAGFRRVAVQGAVWQSHAAPREVIKTMKESLLTASMP